MLFAGHDNFVKWDASWDLIFQEWEFYVDSIFKEGKNIYF